MKQILTIILTICLCTVYGQNSPYPSIKTTGQTINDFIPAGWKILDSATGDLNKDGSKDAAIILQKTDSVSLINSLEDSVLTHPRILILVFKNASTSEFNLIEQSNTFILKNDNPLMDDPYQGIAIEKGVLKLDFHLFHNVGSWYTSNSTYKFRYDGKTFVLIGGDLSTVHRGTLDYEEYSYNFLTRKAIYTKGDGQSGKKKSTPTTISLTTLQNFQTFKQPYSLEIEPDLYL